MRMKYRKMGSLGWEVSALGFGAMRLPMDSKGGVVEEEAIKMIRYAIDHGVNYVDTAFPYHGGKSEVIVGKALQDGYREKVHLATKLPVWLVGKEKDFDKYLKRQIKRMQTNPDLYLFHALSSERLQKVRNLNLIHKMEQARDEGYFKYIGFSFHDGFDAFKEILDYYSWDCCQIQHNYLDVDFQAGTRGVEYAGKKNVALIIMEPIRGGKLAIPDHALERKPELKQILESSPIKRTMADWALQFLWNQPEVSVVLSGMSAMQHVVENVESAEISAINSLSSEELNTIAKLRESFIRFNVVPCTGCRYCMPCPQDVSIPTVLLLLNDMAYYGEKGRKRCSIFYNRMERDIEALKIRKENGEEVEGAASLCIECLECIEKCPQQIDIPNALKLACDIFEEEKPVSEVLD